MKRLLTTLGILIIFSLSIIIMVLWFRFWWWISGGDMWGAVCMLFLPAFLLVYWIIGEID